jgi:membrane-bound lytic murein transglycosylase D
MNETNVLTKRSHRLARRIWLASCVLTLSALIAASFELVPDDAKATCDFWMQKYSDLTFTKQAPRTASISWNSPSPLLTEPSKLDPKDIDSLLSHLVEDPKLAEAQAKPVFDRDTVLSDPDSRITDDFKVSEDMKARVGFWFDIYTKYSSDDRVIHNQKYPWIIYKVVDVAPILYATMPPHRWLRNVQADKFVQSEAKKVRAMLVKISKTKHIEKLSAEEKAIALMLRTLPGKLQKNARDAAREVRIQTGQKDFFSDGLQISARYLADMDLIFTKAKIPTELTRLPLVESSFNHLATSKAGASGIWQFIGGTGRKFLLVDGMIDERRSPFKATMAAARLLKENHQILYRSWPLAVTAYNHGPAGVRRAAKASHSRDIGLIVSRYQTKSFNFASCNYYAEFLAALYAEKYKDKIFSNIQFGDVLADESVAMPRTMKMKQLLKVTGLTAEELTLHNPDLIKAASVNATVPKGFRLHYPAAKKVTLEARLALARSGHLNAWNG